MISLLLYLSVAMQAQAGTVSLPFPGPGGIGCTPSQSWLPFVGSCVVPTLYADTTTEGTTNHYYYSGSTRASFAALLTAASGTFSRANCSPSGSCATYFDGSGVLQYAGTNVARFDHNSTSPFNALGLLREAASTNLFYPSTGIAFSTLANTTTVTTGTATAPDGTSTVETLAFAGSNNSYAYQGDFSGFSVGTATVSFWASGPIGTVLGVRVLNSANALNFQQAVTLTSSSLTRYQVTGTISNVSGGLRFGFDQRSGVVPGVTTTAFNLNLWGFDVEQASFASSYIPTTAAAVTRSSDNLTFSYSSLSSGTFLANSDQESASSAMRILQLDDGSANNRITLSQNASSAAALDVISGGASQAALTIGTYTANTPANAALAFAASDFALTKSGASPSTSASGTVPSGLTTLRVGQDSAGGNMLSGHASMFAVWNNIRGSNGALQSIAP